MSFWSSEKLYRRQDIEHLIDPFDKKRIKHGAYELSVGPEAFITTDPDPKKRRLKPGDSLTLPPGQFGILLTEETVSVPDDAIGFISIRAGIKFRGLVNVSGFHIDPGYSGQLKFAVYNAGSQNIVVSRGDAIFLMWMADLSDPTTDPYSGKNAGQDGISSEDQMLIQGDIASPAALKKEIEEMRHDHDKRFASLEKDITFWRAIGLIVLAALLGTLAKGFLDSRAPVPASPSPTTLLNEGTRESNRNAPTIVNGNERASGDGGSASVPGTRRKKR